jgi:hypothetical protein
MRSSHMLSQSWIGLRLVARPRHVAGSAECRRPENKRVLDTPRSAYLEYSKALLYQWVVSRRGTERSGRLELPRLSQLANFNFLSEKDSCERRRLI